MTSRQQASAAMTRSLMEEVRDRKGYDRNTDDCGMVPRLGLPAEAVVVRMHRDFSGSGPKYS